MSNSNKSVILYACVCVCVNAQACADVRAGPVFWQRMELRDQLSGEPSLPEWLSTHPSHRNRVSQLDRLVPQVHNHTIRQGHSFSSLINTFLIKWKSHFICEKREFSTCLPLGRAGVALGGAGWSPNGTNEAPGGMRVCVAEK